MRVSARTLELLVAADAAEAETQVLGGVVWGEGIDAQPGVDAREE